MGPGNAIDTGPAAGAWRPWRTACSSLPYDEEGL